MSKKYVIDCLVWKKKQIIDAELLLYLNQHDQEKENIHSSIY